MEVKEIKQCRHSKERGLFIFGAIITILLLMILFFAAFDREAIVDYVHSEMITNYKDNFPNDKDLSDEIILKKVSEEERDIVFALDFYYWYVVIWIPLAFFLLLLFAIGKIYGDLRANSVKLSKEQYPVVYQMFEEMALELGFEKIPDLYLVNGNGVLNAYAACVPSYRNFAAVYSDIVERCLRNDDMESLRFILGHELGHIKFNHVKWWYIFLTLWMNVPVIKYLFGLPLSRARELGCDKIGAKLSHDESGRALMMLSAGKYAYQDIDLEYFMQEQFEKKNFWGWFSNLANDHTVLAWRIAAIRKNHQAGLFFKNKN